jgi:ribosomal protein L22
VSKLSVELAANWLRGRALELRSAADRVESAYGSGSGYAAGQYVAKAYRDAAGVLSLAANDAEVDGVDPRETG